MFRPLKTEADYQAALTEVKKLWGAEEGTDAGDKLDLLLVLVNAYEDEHDAIEPPDPIDAILQRLDDKGMTRNELADLLGVGTGRVSEILNRRRPLTIHMIRKLTGGLGLSEHCLLQEYELERQYA
jgi:HTH-type transcriptional regulator/antitoxin HigA